MKTIKQNNSKYINDEDLIYIAIVLRNIIFLTKILRKLYIRKYFPPKLFRFLLKWLCIFQGLPLTEFPT